MRSIARALVAAAVVGCPALMWCVRHNQDGVAAQHRNAIIMTRIYTGPDGQTHAAEVEVKVNPLAGRFERSFATSQTVKTSGSQFMRWSPGYVNDWHPARQRQYVITLSGRGEIELVGGQKIALEPGRIILAEDVTGKGHISRTLGAEECVSLVVHLADE
jgi:quercetin dioxygenase-like cupin family protein